jgi:GMP synthase-like glutamine amidotransferase
MKSLYVLQHTEGEFLGLIEDHLEGRGIRFAYMRPFAAGGVVPPSARFTDGLILLGGGPWGTAGGRDLPSLNEELRLTGDFLARGKPVIGIGLGAQILAIVAGGRSEPSDLAFEVGEARRVRDDALDGFLPERFPLVVYMRDRPLPPADARILAEDAAGRPALFQIGANCLGFTGHPGAKPGMIEDLIMEFEEAPENPAPALERLRSLTDEIQDAFVYTMTGIIRVTGLM